MLYHYLKITFRNLWKNKTQSLIGILGLAFGMACFVPSVCCCRIIITVQCIFQFPESLSWSFPSAYPRIAFTNCQWGYRQATYHADDIRTYMCHLFGIVVGRGHYGNGYRSFVHRIGTNAKSSQRKSCRSGENGIKHNCYIDNS